MKNIKIFTGWVICLVGILYIALTIPDFIQNLGTTPGQNDSVIILVCEVIVLLSGILLIMTKKIVSRPEAIFLLTVAILMAIIILIPTPKGAVVSASGIFGLPLFVLYVIGYVIVLATSRKL